MPANSKPAVRSINITKEHLYSASGMGNGSDSDRGGGHGRQSASATSTSSRNANKMYNAMKDLYNKEYESVERLSETSYPPTQGKDKKAVQQTPRPTTPYGNRTKNFIKQNKSMVSSIIKKKDDISPSVLPNNSVKQQHSQRPLVNAQPSVRTTTRPDTPKLDKKKIVPSNDTPVQRVTSPSARRPASPPAAAHHASAHHLSHARADSPDSAMREEIKKLRRLLALREESLREKELELREKDDIINSLEQRNRELERSLRIKNESKLAADNSPMGILSAIMSNNQRILDIQSDSKSAAPASSPSSPISRSPVSPKAPTPAATPVTKDKEPNKANNNSVRNVTPVVSSVKSHPRVSSPKPTVQTSKKMVRPDLSPSPVSRPVGSVRGNTVYAKKTAADFNVVMETDESEVDESTSENETGDDDSSNSSTEDDSTEAFEYHRQPKLPRDTLNLDENGPARNHGQLVENQDDTDGIGRFTKHELGAIDEDSEDDDDEFELDQETQRQLLLKRYRASMSFKNGSTFNAISSTTDRPIPQNNVQPVQRRLRRNNGNSSNSPKEHQSTANSTTVSASTPSDQNVSTVLNGQSVYSSSHSHMVNGDVLIKNIQRSQPRYNDKPPTKDLNADASSVSIKDYYSHRDSTSSVSSDSSTFSKNGSCSSSATSQSDSELCTPVSAHVNNGFSSENHHPDKSTSSVNSSPLVLPPSYVHGNVSGSNPNGLNSFSAHKNGQAINSNSTSTSHDDQYPTSYLHHAGQSPNLRRSANQSNNSASAPRNGHGFPDSITKSNKQFTDSTSASSRMTDSYHHVSSQNLVSAPLSTSRDNRYPVNTRRTPSPVSPPSVRPLSPASSTSGNNAPTSRAQSPASSSRSSTPASESSRSASGQSRRTPLRESSNAESSSDKNFVQPPPPPPPVKDSVDTLQHFLRMISSQCVHGENNPQNIYDLKKVIDEGSSAKVYTTHRKTNRNEELAIKVVPLTYNLEFIFNELYVLRNFKHEHIVDYKESFLRWDGKNREVWIAMEKCALGDVTSRAGKINEREVSRIARELLEALKHLHSHGVIHRDIKLSNILAGANKETKLADFGISSLTPTSTTSMVGTIPYMAPDVVTVTPDRPYDTKVDIWSLGVCILELLSGKAAWGRIRDDEIMDRLRRGETPYGFRRLSGRTDIGWEVKDFLEKCFASNPDDRWSAESLLEINESPTHAIELILDLEEMRLNMDFYVQIHVA
ncbi:677_t:CDS:2 [Acaulospora colombiana]|uniref:677_t:CDS:1 n=1 Tax=Acaulospora colombiana TaxID=27376 RepID=A0ACA9JXU8_9GLOM|nr:677_t:CDS:2 [Acaulospora colombiana]